MFRSTALAAINHLLAEEPWARERLHPFAGRVVQVNLPPLAAHSFEILPDGTLGAALDEAQAALVVTIPASSAAQIAASRAGLGEPHPALGEPQPIPARPHAALGTGVRFEGDGEMAQAVQFIAANLTWDVEEDLARLIGDIPAHRLVTTGASLLRWQREAATRLAENVQEYLTEESGMLAAPAERQAFSDEVRTVRDGVERLDKRIAMIEARLRARR